MLNIDTINVLFVEILEKLFSEISPNMDNDFALRIINEMKNITTIIDKIQNDTIQNIEVASRRGLFVKDTQMVLDFLYEGDIKSTAASELFRVRGAASLSQEPYVLVLLNGVAEHINKIDELIITYAQGWDMDRMPPIDRNILRIAIYEILWETGVDLQVACDEAVELAKSLSTDESSSYINGVLGRIIKLKDSIAI